MPLKVKRHSCAAILLVISSVLLAGCGTKEQSEPTDTQTTEVEEVKYPVKLTTQFGEVEIKEKPKRVVALGIGDAELALELGFQPVGASDWAQFGGEGVGPWLKDAYTKAPTLLATFDVDYKDVAALKPDLILDTRGWQNKERFAELSKIAPTIAAAPAGKYENEGEMQLAMVGQALGVPGKAHKLGEKVDTVIKTSLTEHPEWKGATFSVVTRSVNGWGAYVDGTTVSFLEKLGLTLNPALSSLPNQSSDGSSVSIDEANLGIVNANIVFAVPIQMNDAEMTKSPAWKAIPAVEAGHSALINSDVQRALELGTPAASMYALQSLAQDLGHSISSNK